MGPNAASADSSMLEAKLPVTFGSEGRFQSIYFNLNVKCWVGLFQARMIHRRIAGSQDRRNAGRWGSCRAEVWGRSFRQRPIRRDVTPIW